MNASVYQGTIVFRQLSDKTGLEETQQHFTSLEELFHTVLNTAEPYLVDRISIEGMDEQGHERVVRFVFQSMSISDNHSKS